MDERRLIVALLRPAAAVTVLAAVTAANSPALADWQNLFNQGVRVWQEIDREQAREQQRQIQNERQRMELERRRIELERRRIESERRRAEQRELSGQRDTGPRQPATQAALSPSELRELQTLLSSAGYYRGAVDGLYGPGTAAAIRAFEADAGLSVTGQPTAVVLEELRRNDSVAAVAEGRQADSPHGSGDGSSPLAGAAQVAASFGARIVNGRILVEHDERHFTSDQRAALQRFFDFVELSLDPTLLDSPAPCWAVEYFPQSVTTRYVRTAPLGRNEYHKLHGKFGRQGNWHGTNEFEVARSREAFVKEQRQNLLERAIAPDFELVFVSPFHFGEYDSQRGGFRLNPGQRVIKATLPTKCAGRSFSYSMPSFVIPELWQVDRQAAEAALRRVSNRRAYLAVGVALRPLETDPQGQRQGVWAGITSMTIYADPDLRDSLAELPLVTAATPAVLTGQADSAPRLAKVTLDAEAIALRLLLEQPDALDDRAWLGLAERQWRRDAAYYKGDIVSVGGQEAERQSRTPTRDPDYVPFFPNDQNWGRLQDLPPERMVAFKEWALARARKLPDTLVFPVKWKTHPSSAVVFEPVSEQDDAPVVAALLAEGLSRRQMVRLPESSSGDQHLLGGGSRRSIVLTLPQLVDSYIPEFSEKDAVAQRGIPIPRPQYHVRIDSTRLLRLPDGSEAIVVQAVPERLEIWNGQLTDVIYERRFDAVALDPKRLDHAELTVAPPNRERLALTAETMDLLIARHAPERLTDLELERMMIARWAYETSKRANPAPDWGRFFVPGKPAPGAAERANLLPRFREWTTRRAAALPGRFTLTLDSAQIGDDGRVQPNEPWDMFEKRRSMGAEIVNCTAQAGSMPALTVGCSYLREALDNEPRVYPFGSGTYPAGPRFRCGTDAYCQTGLKAYAEHLDGRAGLPARRVRGNAIEYDFRDVVILDREAFLPSNQAKARNTGSFKVEVDVEIKDLQVADAPPPHPLSEAEKRYQEFREAISGQQRATQPAARRAAGPYHVISAHVIAARLVNGDKVLADLDLREPRSFDVAKLSVEQAVAPPAAQGPYGPDIVGLRLGLSFAEAEAIIRKHMVVERVLKRDRANQATAATGNFERFSSATMFVAEGGKEFIILYDEPPAAEQVVVGITRQLALSAGQLNAASALALMREKYGRETWSSPRGIVGWGESLRQAGNALDNKCIPGLRSAPVGEWAESDGSPTKWKPMGRGAPGVVSVMKVYNHARGQLCGAVVSMDFTPGRQAGEDDRLVVQVGDLGRYEPLFQASKEQIASGAASYGSTEQAKDLKL